MPILLSFCSLFRSNMSLSLFGTLSASLKSLVLRAVLCVPSGIVISIRSLAMYALRLSIHSGAPFLCGKKSRPSLLSGCLSVSISFRSLCIAPRMRVASFVWGLVIASCSVFSFSAPITSAHLSHPIPIHVAQKASSFVVFAILYLSR